MNLEIITPDKSVFSGEVKLVQLPGVTGSFEVMNNHAPIISILGQGKIKALGLKNEETFFDVESGVVEVSDNKVVVLAESV